MKELNLLLHGVVEGLNLLLHGVVEGLNLILNERNYIVKAKVPLYTAKEREAEVVVEEEGR